MAGAGNLNIKGGEALSSADRTGLERKIRASRRRAVPYDPRTRTGGELRVVPEARKVENPYEVGPAKIEAQVNRRVDLLEQERSLGRTAPIMEDGLPKFGISQAAFVVGREIQAVFEAASRITSPTGLWVTSSANRGNAADASVVMHAAKRATADRVHAAETRLAEIIGRVGVRELRGFLTGTTYEQYAAARGRSGERAIADVAKRFRWFLEEIAKDQAVATGPERSRGIRADRGG